MSNLDDKSVRRASSTASSGAIVPLGVSLLAAPGSISSVIVETRHGARSADRFGPREN
jgi:small neutral amino acid transporter SnatA (MarC family)